MFDLDRSPKVFSREWGINGVSPRLRLAARLYKSRTGVLTEDIVNVALHRFLTERAPDLLEQADTLLGPPHWTEEGEQSRAGEWVSWHNVELGRARKGRRR